MDWYQTLILRFDRLITFPLEIIRKCFLIISGGIAIASFPHIHKLLKTKLGKKTSYNCDNKFLFIAWLNIDVTIIF